MVLFEETEINEKIHQDKIQDIFSFFTEEEILRIKSSKEIGNYNNPLKIILCSPDNISSLNITDDRNSLLINTNQSFKIIKTIDPGWLEYKRKSLFSNDYAVISSTLGEIRAYAEIYSKLFNNRENSKLFPVPTEKGNKTPDFRLDFEDYYSVFNIIDFEVFTRTPDKENQKGQILEESVMHLEGTSKKLTFTISTHTPFSSEKRGTEASKIGSKLRHLIHLFTQIKNADKQFTDKNINVLWVDMCDENISQYVSFLTLGPPFITRDGYFISSPLWHAVYGKKQMIILHETNQGESYYISKSRMEHNGRFCVRSNKTDFVLFRFPRKTIVYENTRTKKVIPQEFRELLTYLPFYSSIESRIDFPRGNLKVLLNTDIMVLKNLYKYLDDRETHNE